MKPGERGPAWSDSTGHQPDMTIYTAISKIIAVIRTFIIVIPFSQKDDSNFRYWSFYIKESLPAQSSLPVPK